MQAPQYTQTRFFKFLESLHICKLCRKLCKTMTTHTWPTWSDWHILFNLSHPHYSLGNLTSLLNVQEPKFYCVAHRTFKIGFLDIIITEIISYSRESNKVDLFHELSLHPRVNIPNIGVFNGFVPLTNPLK